MDEKYILIVSDDKDLQDKIKHELEGNNIVFTWARDNSLGMQMVAAKEYYAAIVEVDLSAVTSYDFLYRLGILRSSMPVVALSQRLTADNILLAYDVGVTDIIDKDFADGELSAIMDKILTI